MKHSKFEYFLQSNRTYGVVELSLWLVRVLSNVRSWYLYLEMMKWQHALLKQLHQFSICSFLFFIFTNFQLTGLVCVHSLWTVWREEKSLFRSLHQLGIVSWISKIMIMVRDTFYWWSRRWWRWWRCWVTGRQIRHACLLWISQEEVTLTWANENWEGSLNQ